MINKTVYFTSKNVDYTNVILMTQKNYKKIEVRQTTLISICLGMKNKNHIQFTYQKRNSTIC